MTRQSPVVTDWPIGVASGRLRWARDGDDLIAGPYRLRPLGPERWEVTYRGRLLAVHRRRSIALAQTEHHHRETQRRRQIARYALLSVVALLGSAYLAGRISTLTGFVLFALGVGVFLSSVVRCFAAASRNLFDPYRRREPWEPPDWWNRQL